MNRQQRRATKREQHDFVRKLPARLTPLPESEWPVISPKPTRVWVNRKYLVQLYDEANEAFPAMLRLSICHTKIGADMRWVDGLAWDELQAIKAEVGFGDWYAVEVYPRSYDVVNVANFRHLWLLPVPLQIGWFGRL